MDVFSTHLAFALDEMLDIPVYAKGDERIDDAASFVEVGAEGGMVKLSVMTIDGLPTLRSKVNDIVKQVTRSGTQIKITDQMAITATSMQRTKATIGEAPYADRIDVLLACDVETFSARRVA
jgi:hypothetical protein